MTQPFVLPFEDSLAHPRHNGNCRFHHSLAESLAESLANLAAYHHSHNFSGTRYTRMKKAPKKAKGGKGRARKGLESYWWHSQSRHASQHAHPNLSDGIAQNRVGTTPSSTNPRFSLPRPRVPICLPSLDCPVDFPSSRDCGRSMNAR